MADLTLQTSVQFVRGVGPNRAALLERLGLQTVQDLLYFLPRDVLDLTQVTPLSELAEGKLATVRGRVVDRDGRQLKDGKSLCGVLLDCDGQFLRGVWFNQPWMLQKFRDEEYVLFSGKPKRHAGRWELSNPRVQWLNADDRDAHGGMLPIYSLTEGLHMHEMRRIMRTTVEDCAGLLADELPEPWRGELKVPQIGEALRGVHLPTNREQYDAGRRRLILQDLLELQLGLAMRRRTWQKLGSAARLPVTAKIDSRIRRLLPYQLTAGQNKAVTEICRDLDSTIAMHRLLQADVGAGKTAVAVYAMLVAVAAGYQTVLMAPTEVLASQHWRTVDRLLSQSRVTRTLLTGQLTASERRAALAQIGSGEMQLIIGTQAVIQDDVTFARLGLVIIDEQHKFGVMQRARFSAWALTPHTLVMTATPIPRSLCLTQFGDLDLSTMTDLPPGRQKVVTTRVPAGPARQKVWDFLKQKVAAGRQAYVICPRVGASTETGDDSEGTGAEQVYRRLAEQELQGLQVGLAHGQMPAELKGAAMDDFRSGKIQVLVATTVVEVGVDVPNATLMIILGAESFGLSQLHQLRGRIGRGSFQGYCFLFADSQDPTATERLLTLEKHPGGFEVAEADFRLRGPGDILGTRQHGELPLLVADLARDEALLQEARVAAFELVQSGQFDQPPFAPLKCRVIERFGKLFDLAGSG
ncbi:MAG: ATP-dependent DNA helicase RecG [Planctomycetes bacterium]|nr:ATP-dependent DNA helicase RecG [Planctomycetota bacterium]